MNKRPFYREFYHKIAFIHAKFETIRSFSDGNGRIGRALINQQLGGLGYPPIIIRNKSKTEKYYPLFDAFVKTDRSDGFSELFAILLMESLHKRITILTSRQIIALTDWANANGVATNVMLNRASRQTIPAFG